jgi:hypothetical protein
LDISLDTWILVLRILLVVIIYAFLYQVAAAIYRSLRASDAPPLTELRVNRPAGLLTDNPGLSAPLQSVAPPATLLVVKSGIPTVPVGTTFTVKSPTRLGRSTQNAIVLPESFVSAEHALIDDFNGQLRLQDLGSTNGTLLNGEPVTAPLALVSGDSIQVGTVRFVVRFEVQP